MKTRWLAFVFCELALLWCVGPAAQVGPNGNSCVTLAWDQSADPSVVGYHVYFGSASRLYMGFVDAGNTNCAAIPRTIIGTSCYFAVTAYTALGIESAFSDEIIVARLLPSTTPNSPAGTFGFNIIGPVGQNWRIECSTNLVDWQWVTNLVATNVWTPFQDCQATNDHCFYRALPQ